MTTCTQCHLLNLRLASPTQNYAGWGVCTATGQPATPMFVMYSRERVCAMMEPAADELVAARVKWINNLEKKNG